ncbi:unnamed protein product [Hymenolepis diminuta]|uniref:Non-specific serine/threonine protein kinase n=1 Tax=Hymenolepis diminuta TaxID=6216 RepID=A0A0R3SPI5_HYMDI|nr:unnamed protein product [Hymenolepis diminuta]
MAANGTTLGPSKAHRVSRHVSFQAVVPPAVSFPVNYSGPSLIQANNYISLARQNSDSSPEELKQRAGRQMSTVISLDYNRDSPDSSTSNSTSLFDEVLHTVHIQYKIPLFFEIQTHGNETEISSPTRIQPWDNFNLRHIQSRFANELQRYICRVLNYAQSIGIISNFNSSENCDHYDNDRVNAVYEILQMMQEVKLLRKNLTLLSL